MAKRRIIRNFIGEKVIIIKISKPLNQSTKVVNNSESSETILSKLLKFASSVTDLSMRDIEKNYTLTTPKIVSSGIFAKFALAS